MKIDKVIFTTSEEYSDFWNINSKVFKTYLGIDPVCFLFGKIKNTNMSEQYGRIQEVEHDPSLHKLLQLTWFKFHAVTLEPETTWMIGDIDQIPLQRNWFVDNIKEVPDDYYIHLNAGACAESIGRPANYWETNGGLLNGGVDLPAHYHIAKGKIFKKGLNISDRFTDDIKKITNANRYGMGVTHRGILNSADKYYWCAEENYTSEQLFNAKNNETVKIQTFCYNNTRDKIDRSRMDSLGYIFDHHKLNLNQYVDIHCERPYRVQEFALMDVLRIGHII